jgi:hypothetical protein
VTMDNMTGTVATAARAGLVSVVGTTPARRSLIAPRPRAAAAV